MHYMLAFYEPDSSFTARDDQSDQFWPPWRVYFRALGEAGVTIGGAPLQPPARAVTVRSGGDRQTVHDGPYADTKEQLGGFVIVDVPALDDALAWARRAPSGQYGAVEVRPLLPATSAATAAQASAIGDARYVLAIYESADDFAAREGAASSRYWAGWAAYAEALNAAAVRRGGAALHGPHAATVIRSSAAGPVVHDGPYADTKEQLGGYLLLDVPTLEDALHWAARCPATFNGAVEVRPVLPVSARV